jgi:hypothetical protein
MTNVLALHEDIFFEYFKPYRHPDSIYEIWGGYGIETFGTDFELVRRLDPAYVWTIVDGECDQWITTGVHYVNRICYLVTRVPHNDLNVEFRVSCRPSRLTPVGLRRQITKIYRAIEKQVVSSSH